MRSLSIDFTTFFAVVKCQYYPLRAIAFGNREAKTGRIDGN
jgi:hypothetical protein